MGRENKVVFSGKDESIRYAAVVLFRKADDYKEITEELSRLYINITRKLDKM